MNSSMKIDTEAVLKQFDELVEQGELFHGPTEPHVQQDQGINFEFRIVDHFKNKPQVSLDGKSRTTAQSDKRPPPSDGSDIDHSDPAFFVADIRGTHKLILNKFCVFRPQYILLTQDPKRRQSEPLTVTDFEAAWTTLCALTTRHYVIFNGGIAAGSSRNHKHMQLLEEPRAPNLPLQVSTELPFHYFKDNITITGDIGVPAQLTKKYEEDMKACRKLLGIGPDDSTTQVAHNVVMTKDWFVVIPRARPTIEGINGHIVNATGMLGLIWNNNQEQVKGWKDVGPAKVLSQLAIARNSGTDRDSTNSHDKLMSAVY